MTNRLIHATSPYLLQHAHNPVDWYEWGTEALSTAKEFDRPILVSIGYSACHWCHVMERESFEDRETAVLMNDLFVCIKIDREERPDLDTIYMSAVQAMGFNGGWPLNVFLTPDGEPFYGGTYFPREKWNALLWQVSEAYRKHRKEVLGTAKNLTNHLAKTDIQKFKLGAEGGFEPELLSEAYDLMKESFDRTDGGTGTAPKFPMPCIYDFLMRFSALTGNDDARKQLLLTLDKMQSGGIFDQVEGGFARYSTDEIWLVPHFEKMLYDNAQLLGLYAEAYAFTGNERYKRTVEMTADFLEEQLSDPEGGFYSALDADSEGEEGKYYVWAYEEFCELLKDENPDLAAKFFSVLPEGNFEGKNILTVPENFEAFGRENGVTPNELEEKFSAWIRLLKKDRETRTKPGLDDKILAAWNGMCITGLCKAFRYSGDEKYLRRAEKCADFIIEKMLKGKQLFRTYKKGTAKIPAFLEDYAAVIEGLIALYEVSGAENRLLLAGELTDFCLTEFFDAEENTFFFTSSSAEKLITRPKETFDNVIPASNSVMAENLLRAGFYLEKSEYREISRKMTLPMSKLIKGELRYTSRWASVFLLHAFGVTEAAVCGKNADEKAKQAMRHYFPDVIFACSTSESGLPLLKNRFSDDAKFYLCRNYACGQPIADVEAALSELKNLRR
jgi:uncharacterized protein YyaL (SSP411 family)